MALIRDASIRPGRFGPGEVPKRFYSDDQDTWASIRPGRFGPGEFSRFQRGFAHRTPAASIRPGRFGPGEVGAAISAQAQPIMASIRPGRFGPGEPVAFLVLAGARERGLQLGPGALARERRLSSDMARLAAELQLGPGALARESLWPRNRIPLSSRASIRPGRFGPGEDLIAASHSRCLTQCFN